MIKTALGTYVHSQAVPEMSGLMPKMKKHPKPRGKRIKPGCRAMFCGYDCTVIGKHTNKGWWIVKIDCNGEETAGDRKLIAVL